MTYREFENRFKPILTYLEERDRANEGLKLLASTSYCSIDIGGNLLDRYIRLLEEVVGDSLNMISWYVFDNDLGKNKFTVSVGSKSYKIKNLKDLYNLIEAIKKYENGSIKKRRK